MERIRSFPGSVIRQKRRKSLALALARTRGAPLEPPDAIKSNSEPWTEALPDSVEAAIAISDRVRALAKQWQLE